MDASVAYISAATNRHPTGADVCGSLIAIASSSLVTLWDVTDVSDRGFIETLPGHDGQVTAVRFITKDSFASADDRGVLRYWKKHQSQWRSSKVQAHGKAISALCVYNECLASGSSDSSVKIWAIPTAGESDEIQETQHIALSGIFPFAIAMSSLPQSKSLILAVSGTDRNIHIWTRSQDKFIRSATLPGHEDWIRCLAFCALPAEDQPLTLASGSQDGTIRLWNIEPYKKESSSAGLAGTENLSDELLDAFEATLGDLTDAEEGGRQISMKRHILTVRSDQESSQQISISFDALLVGHEAGVTSLSWRPDSTSTLLSTSTDSSVILWSPSTVITTSRDESTSIWINRQRFGDVGGQRLGGFVGGVWASDGREALAWGWSGGWRRWRCDAPSGRDADENWSEVGAVGGHNGPVKDAAWSPNGDYLISTGLDQTTRIHGPIPGSNGSSWHELSRPQVHGYDLLGAVFVDALKFVSIADEKVARVFEAPRNFVSVLEKLGVSHFAEDEHGRPSSAAVPPLGLSNKALSEGRSEDVDSSRRPFEGELASVTLWPEIEKVFGHGYESMSLAISNSRHLIATACKATTPEHAVVRLYETVHWQPIGAPLEGHSLTVTRIAFSPDDKLVLTVSRDRSWRLYSVQDNNTAGYLPLAADKSHGRIIWDCAWAHESDLFATASRDKTVKIWSQADSKWAATVTIKTSEAATAVDFASTDERGRRHLAIGLESGEILIYTNQAPSADWQLSMTIPTRTAHVNHINRLAWRPISQTGSRDLASCSEDGTLKVLTVHMVMD